MNDKENHNSHLIPRPPVVVVMGHIDHGKTTLLDYIRKTKVAEKETGAITQHIGAYEVEIVLKDGSKKTITFLDTPGHENFSRMRSRGAQVADLAILVVAADEGVQPQTIEALEHIKAANIPYLVAINKIDKPNINLDNIKRNLAESNIFLEGWGGNIPYAEISAKTGQGIDNLLELILLLAEMENLKGDPSQPAEGVVIESYLDNKRGYTTTLLIKNGTLHKGDNLVIGSLEDKVKIVEDFRGQMIETAGFSSPVLVVGFKELPMVGEKFRAGDLSEIELANSSDKTKIYSHLELVGDSEISEKIFLIIKTDVYGSIDALREELKNIAAELNLTFGILKSEVGDINETDLKLAETNGAYILGFRVKIRPELKTILAVKKISIITGQTIYELSDEFKKKLTETAPQENKVILGELKILAIFKPVKNNQIVGGEVISGQIENQNLVEIYRDQELIGQGTILNLQQNKLDVKAVTSPSQCGLCLETKCQLAIGDRLICYRWEKRK